jgi:hypothetical protein
MTRTIHSSKVLGLGFLTRAPLQASTMPYRLKELSCDIH